MPDYTETAATAKRLEQIQGLQQFRQQIRQLTGNITSLAAAYQSHVASFDGDDAAEFTAQSFADTLAAERGIIESSTDAATRSLIWQVMEALYKPA